MVNDTVNQTVSTFNTFKNALLDIDFTPTGIIESFKGFVLFVYNFVLSISHEVLSLLFLGAVGLSLALLIGLIIYKAGNKFNSVGDWLSKAGIVVVIVILIMIAYVVLK